MTTLLLIRHATNDWVGKRLAGWTPGVELNEQGRAEALDLAERLKDLPISAIYSSPLERAQQTAEAVAQALGLTVGTRDGLGEVRYGEWQGQSLEELPKTELWQMVQGLPSRARFPGGETLAEAQARMVHTLEQLAAAHPGDEEVIAVFSHGDVIKAAVAFYAGLHLDLFQRLVVQPASVSVIFLGKGAPRILRLNDTGRLTVPQPKGEEAHMAETEEQVTRR